MSSLENVVLLGDIVNKNGGHYDLYDNDDYWYQRELRKNAEYRSGPVTVINFEYLETN